MAGPLRATIETIGKHPFATGLLALVSLVGFGVSVVGFGIDRSEADATTQQIAAMDGRISARLAEPWASKPHFSGDWSPDTAVKLAWPTANTPPANDEWHELSEPKLERSFFIPLRDSDVRIIITGQSEGDCNACMVQLSLFLFRKDGDVWYLDQFARNFTRAGYSGELNYGDGLRDLDVWTLGDNRFGFVIPSSSWYQGEALEGYQIFSFVADEMVQVFDGITRVYFAGLEKDEAIDAGMWFENSVDLSFDESEASFGFKDMQAEYSTTDTPRSTLIRIPFNGEEYPYPDFGVISDCVEEMDYPPSLDISNCS